MKHALSCGAGTEILHIINGGNTEFPRELPLFTEQITRLLDDADYGRFQVELLRWPKKGDVIPQSGGLRKVRLRLPGRGKSGGARVIYLHLPKYETIVLFYLYTKSRREDLSPEQLKRLRQAASIIKQRFKP